MILLHIYGTVHPKIKYIYFSCGLYLSIWLVVRLSFQGVSHRDFSIPSKLIQLYGTWIVVPKEMSLF